MNTRGFSVIELVVVLVIIGLLASLVYANVRKGSDLTRDTRRVADLESFQDALELYYLKNRVYPCGDNEDDATWSGMDDTSGDDGFLDGVPEGTGWAACVPPESGLHAEGILLDHTLEDPLNMMTPEKNHIYFYRVTADRQSYILYAVMEAKMELADNDSDKGLCNTAYEVGPGTGAIPLWTSALGTEIEAGC